MPAEKDEKFEDSDEFLSGWKLYDEELERRRNREDFYRYQRTIKRDLERLEKEIEKKEKEIEKTEKEIEKTEKEIEEIDRQLVERDKEIEEIDRQLAVLMTSCFVSNLL